MALLPIQICAIGMEKQTYSLVKVRRCQDGRAVQGAAFRSQSTHVGVGSNPTPDTSIKVKLLRTFARNFSNIHFFLKILPLKDHELATSEM